MTSTASKVNEDLHTLQEQATTWIVWILFPINYRNGMKRVLINCWKKETGVGVFRITFNWSINLQGRYVWPAQRRPFVEMPCKFSTFAFPIPRKGWVDSDWDLLLFKRNLAFCGMRKYIDRILPGGSLNFSSRCWKEVRWCIALGLVMLLGSLVWGVCEPPA